MIPLSMTGMPSFCEEEMPCKTSSDDPAVEETLDGVTCRHEDVMVSLQTKLMFAHVKVSASASF